MDPHNPDDALLSTDDSIQKHTQETVKSEPATEYTKTVFHHNKYGVAAPSTVTTIVTPMTITASLDSGLWTLTTTRTQAPPRGR